MCRRVQNTADQLPLSGTALEDYLPLHPHAAGFAITYLSIGFAILLTTLLGIPLMLRRIPPNELYGLRIEATRRSERVWYEANAQLGRDVLGLGIVVSGVLAVGAWTINDEAFVALGVCLIFVVGLLVLTVRGIRNARRLLEKEHAS